MKLYGAAASPYVTRVIMFAGLKGLELQRPPVPGGNPRSAEFHAINPIGKVPSLDLDGDIIPESEVICEYLEDAYPDVTGLPAHARDRATSRLVARITDLYISPTFGPLLPHLNPAARDQAEVDRIAAEHEKAFRALAHYMGPGPFCVASEPSLGDCALGPYIKLLKNVVFSTFGIADPTDGNGRLATWWQAMESHNFCRLSLDEYGAAVDAFMRENEATITEHR
jgi:glutathione S-transferase